MNMARMKYLVEKFRETKLNQYALVSAGDRKPSGMLQGSSDVTRYAITAGAKVSQTTLILTDPKTYKSTPVICVCCFGVLPTQKDAKDESEMAKKAAAPKKPAKKAPAKKAAKKKAVPSPEMN